MYLGTVELGSEIGSTKTFGKRTLELRQQVSGLSPLPLRLLQATRLFSSSTQRAVFSVEVQGTSAYDKGSRAAVCLLTPGGEDCTVWSGSSPRHGVALPFLRCLGKESNVYLGITGCGVQL